MAKLFRFIAFLLAVSQSSAQLLSNGAADWYMRFHFVKRSINAPTVKSFQVQSVVKHRYVVTQVRSVVHNPAMFSQTYKFGYVMAKSALVSNVTLVSNGGTFVKSSVDASDWALMFMRKHDQENSNSSLPSANGDDDHHGANGGANGGSNGYGDDHDDVMDYDSHLNYLHHREDFKQFVLPINIQPLEEITITLTYEYLLERTDNAYTHTLSISPGEIVPDFQIRMTVVENRPISSIKVMAPVIGDITDNLKERSDQVKSLNLNLSEVEQYNYFGMHGFTGDFKVTYDMVEDPKVTDLIVQDDFFVHFFNVPQRMTMKSIPKHVIFLLDVSDSMDGPKLDHAKQSIDILLQSLDESHYVNLLTFSNETQAWRPDNGTDATTAFQCTNETQNAISESLLEIGSKIGTTANILQAVADALELDKEVWATQSVPENALSMIILLTDGRSAAGNDSETIAREIRQMNKPSKIPIFALGIGFDANLEFMEDLAEASCGKTCIGNVIEDMAAEQQLRTVKKHLNDVVLKDLSLNYVGDAFITKSLTKNQFNVFHQGGSVAVSGQFNADDAYSRFRVEISGQSADGSHTFRPTEIPFVTNGCYGEAQLCTEPSFGGNCVTLNASKLNLKEVEFNNKAVSVNVTGTCAWIAYEYKNYLGRNITLMPGEYEGLPGEMHKKTSSLRIVAVSNLDGNKVQTPKRHFGSRLTPDNSVGRLWAFVTIKDVLERAANDETTKEEIERAYSLAMKYHFLTPFTNIYFTTNMPQPPAFVGSGEQVLPVEPDTQIFQNNLLTYGDLSPILYNDDPNSLTQFKTLTECNPPIKCEGSFHYEEFVEKADEGKIETDNEIVKDAVNCNGSITLFTKPDFKGEALTVQNVSIRQLYHDVNSQRMRSIRSQGNCCWLLFDHRFFSAGTVERFCGDKDEPLRRTNIGSIQRMNQSPEE